MCWQKSTKDTDIRLENTHIVVYAEKATSGSINACCLVNVVIQVSQTFHGPCKFRIITKDNQCIEAINEGQSWNFDKVEGSLDATKLVKVYSIEYDKP